MEVCGLLPSPCPGAGSSFPGVIQPASRKTIVLASALTSIALVAAAVAAAAGTDAERAGSAPYFAPYIDMAAYPPPNLVSIGESSEARMISLGFVTADRGKNANGKASCKPTWGGYSDYPARGKQPYRSANVKGFTSDGGKIVLSFGGAAGTELASACKSPKALAAAYRAAIKAYKAKRVDFDVEGAAIGEKGANDRRAQALRKLRKMDLKVSFTLPTTSHGLDAKAKAVVKGLRSKHVKVGIFNAMAMDYGEPGEGPNPDMGDLAIGVGDALHGQLRSLLHVNSGAAWKKVGLTPMIGINDVSKEVFGLADANDLSGYAREKGIGMLGMWQLARDHDCNQPTTQTREDCSGYRPQYDFQFTEVLSGGPLRGG